MSTGDAQATTAAGVVDAVTAVPGVTGLYGGVFGEIATYLPGRRVNGVVLTDDSAEVHIVVDATHDLREVASAVRETVHDLTGVPTVVTVEDISVRTEPIDAADGGL
ncbi:hypothetical protein VX037_06895 [Gordonia sp. Z-3]|uniref:Asp23/Gls24 family envelope stress response protein n=1 Tax=Gordonia tangerina TaxID=2911060 RepID=A0ABS9DEY7_9ACTN|nr:MULTISPECIES: hypothetical protein [Gordonia]MAU84072.1 hypothetical protein [Gordonia sp. (in: high G+C Gram-positive bacteria)]MCF3937782.1 hypothetical protein [Gordonia tangerina]MED5800750.1 hypothetical protein [Gordonia sp. Z-3]